MQIRLINSTKHSANTYIVSEENKAVIIDPGYRAAPVFDYIKRNNLEIGFILITHGHPDHCYCAAEFNKVGIKTYITQNDYELPKFYTGKAFDAEAKFELFTPTFYPQEGHLEFAGMEFEIIQAPGHSFGGVCIACGQYLFTGDTLFYNTVGRTDLPTGDERQLYNTLKNLFSLDKDYVVLPGHGRRTTLFDEKINNPFAGKVNQNSDKVN